LERIRGALLGYQVKSANHIRIFSSRHNKYVNFYPSSGRFNVDGLPAEGERGVEACLRFIRGFGGGSGYRRFRSGDLDICVVSGGYRLISKGLGFVGCGGHWECSVDTGLVFEGSVVLALRDSRVFLRRSYFEAGGEGLTGEVSLDMCAFEELRLVGDVADVLCVGGARLGVVDI
jgi:hypothetical protein